ncbi:MAG TPA: 4a-hydroxytetrahydrobiopterin dehydratase [Acidimicrobiia bacterium]|nr:4a-hydroxytetrahydrobiopterin dehydratase [Acidimicrobiia bacterium]
MSLATQKQIEEFLAGHPDWSIDDGELTTTVTMKDFVGAMGLVTRIALLAETANHHPNIAISWNKVTLRLSTHSEGGITGKDLDLADQLPLA